jgi:hypothetical protein
VKAHTVGVDGVDGANAPETDHVRKWGLRTAIDWSLLDSGRT